MFILKKVCKEYFNLASRGGGGGFNGEYLRVSYPYHI